MTTLISFLSGWGLLVSLLGCLAGCVLRLRQCKASGCNPADFAVRWRARLVPLDLLRGQWPEPLTIVGVVLLLVGVAWAVRIKPVHAGSPEKAFS